MPELPEVETTRLGLCPALEGRRLVRIIQRRPDLRFPLPGDFAARLRHRRVVALRRRGKALLADLDDGTIWLAHLGMSGRFLILPSGAGALPPGPHDHLSFYTDAGAEVRYCDPRRFGYMALARHEADLPGLAAMGPEPLARTAAGRPALTGPVLARRLAGRRGPLKTVLLDQKTVAGLGNIYVCEALYRAGLAPDRPAAGIVAAQARDLARAIRAVLRAAIAAGGSSLRDFRDAAGHPGYFQTRFSVYGRAGEPCPACPRRADPACRIRRIAQAGRATFYCPRRQA